MVDVYVLPQKAVAHFAGVSEAAVSQAVKRRSLVAARVELDDVVPEPDRGFSGITLGSAARYFKWSAERVDEIKDELDNLPSRTFLLIRKKSYEEDPDQQSRVWFYEPHPLASGKPSWEKR